MSKIEENITFDDKKIDYFYSGKDIGSNEYRDFNEMCILYGQGINKSYVNMLADFFEGDPEEIRNKYLLQRTIQLIGRTAIRKNPANEVKIKIIHFLDIKIEELINYFCDSKLLEIKEIKLENYEKKTKDLLEKIYIEIKNNKYEFTLNDEIEKAYQKIRGKEIKVSNRND